MIESVWTAALPPLPSSLVPLGPRAMLPSDYRNSLIDRWFYDVSALSAAEQDLVLACPQREGAALVVPPAKSGAEIEYVPRRSFPRLKDMPFAGVAVAGVGSSALGAAALARNVADFVGAPVAGVVCGRGLPEVVSEALGGWLLFRAEAAVGEAFSTFQRVAESLRLPPPRKLKTDDGSLDGFIGRSPDSKSLDSLLYQMSGKVRFLVGHSKGNLLIANALRGLALRRPEVAAKLAAVRVVTLGASVAFPDSFTGVFQVRGGHDSFGRLNSEVAPDLEIPGAWHHLNPEIPCFLPVAQALTAAGLG